MSPMFLDDLHFMSNELVMFMFYLDFNEVGGLRSICFAWRYLLYSIIAYKPSLGCICDYSDVCRDNCN